MPRPDHTKRTGFLLSKVGWATTAAFREALAPLGLKPAGWAILNALDRSDGLSQHALGETIRIDPSSMVAHVDELERNGLVERRREVEDRRRYSIRLTPKGRRVLGRARLAAQSSEERLLTPLTPEERSELNALLVKLATAGHLPPTPHPPVNPEPAPAPGTAAGAPSRPSAGAARRRTSGTSPPPRRAPRRS